MTQDPAQPTRFVSAIDSGNHLHPSDIGYQARGVVRAYRRGRNHSISRNVTSRLHSCAVQGMHANELVSQ